MKIHPWISISGRGIRIGLYGLGFGISFLFRLFSRRRR